MRRRVPATAARSAKAAARTITANVYVTLKPGLLDAQGKTIRSALASLGFPGIKQVRVGKYLEIELERHSAAAVQKEVEQMCDKLLANPVIETYRVKIDQRKAVGSRQ